MGEAYSEKIFRKLFLFAEIVGVPYKGGLLRSPFIILVHVSSGIGYALTLLVAICKSNNIETKLGNIPVLLGCAIIPVKVGNVYFNFKTFCQLRNSIVELDHKIQDDMDRNYLKRRITVASKGSMIYAGNLFICCCGGFLTAALSKGKMLIFGAWFPIDWTDSLIRYVTILSYQTFGIFMIAFQDGLSDILRIICIYMISGHVHLLGQRISRVGYKQSGNADESYAELVECIKTHQIILRLSKKVQRIISGIYFINLAIVGINICVSLFCAVLIQDTVSKKSFNYSYVMLLLSQFMFQCYFGTELQGKSEKLTNSIYACNWMDQESRFKKTLLVFQLRAQRGIQLYCGRITPISLQTFVTVLKSSYSFFAVLNHMYK